MSSQEPNYLPLEMAHVLFMDVVGYSKFLIDQQKEVLEKLQEIVSETTEFRRAQARQQLISLPTGDGIALVFFGDVVAPVRCALSISRELKPHPEIQMRMGIHSGPVYRVADINRNQNVAGGGINIAQRVMDCGDGGHILLSKEVVDVLTAVSEWSEYLHDFGEVEVKHGVRLHIFNLLRSEVGNPEKPKKLRPETRAWLVPSLGTMVSKLCNRSPQVSTFTDFFIAGLNQEAVMPQICIIHGEEKECHESLVERLLYVHITPIAAKKWGLEKSVVAFKKMRWAYDGTLTQRQQELKRMLFADFDPAYMEDDLSASALSKLTARLLTPIVAIQHNIFAQQWDRLTPQLLGWYMNYWTEIRKQSPRFLIFLNVIYPKTQPAARWKTWISPGRVDKEQFRVQLEELCAFAPADCQCVLLKELVSPRRYEVEEWFSYHNIYDTKLQSELTETIFSTGKVTMADIEHALSRIHQTFVKEKGYA